jgi:putative PIN family toxin of toxin-antitoxin system
MSDQPKVVFDCNTFLQAMAAPVGPAGRCVQLAFDQRVSLFASPFVLEELREVASRPKVAAKLQLTATRVDEFIEALELAATILDQFASPVNYPRDPDDAHYINLAVAADATLIVSRDKDLLDLMDLTRLEAAQFQAQFPRLRIVTPVEFLRGIAVE